MVGTVKAGPVPALRKVDLGNEPRPGRAGRNRRHARSERQPLARRGTTPSCRLIRAARDCHEACGEGSDISTAALVHHPSTDRGDANAVLEEGRHPVGGKITGVIARRRTGKKRCSGGALIRRGVAEELMQVAHPSVAGHDDRIDRR